ncbi:MAG: hypothetical protein LBJ88_02790 [Campylobacteraceae bacterium]|jgi:hypothetical protein|nr:hypothetical protein [Campylobacteraceae bacterium]
MLKVFRLFVSILLSTVLIGCGGGGDGSVSKFTTLESSFGKFDTDAVLRTASIDIGYYPVSENSKNEFLNGIQSKKFIPDDNNAVDSGHYVLNDNNINEYSAEVYYEKYNNNYVIALRLDYNKYNNVISPSNNTALSEIFYAINDQMAHIRLFKGYNANNAYYDDVNSYYNSLKITYGFSDCYYDEYNKYWRCERRDNGMSYFFDASGESYIYWRMSTLEYLTAY